MAVVIQCYHCETILELDEGFRGGVCRCSTCGSLLQVPKAAAATGTPKARPAAPGAVVSDGQRPANPNVDPGLSRGQFDPKNQSGGRPAVPDLGGSSSGLRQGRPAGPAVAAKAPKIEKVSPISGPTRPGPHLRRVKKSNTLLYVGIALVGVVVVVAVVVLVMVMMHANDGEPKPKKGGEVVGGQGQVAPGNNGRNGTTPTPDDGGPVDVQPTVAKGFLGMPLTGKKIMLSVDGASSMSESIDFVRYGVYRAMGQLEDGQTLRVALWKGTTLKMVPASGFVGKSGLKTMRAELDAISATGSSDAAACIKASVKLGADQVIFVTAKDSLDMQVADGVVEAAGANVRLDGVKIESRDDPSPLELLAGKTGGKYEYVTGAQLEKMAK